MSIVNLFYKRISQKSTNQFLYTFAYQFTNSDEVNYSKRLYDTPERVNDDVASHASKMWAFISQLALEGDADEQTACIYHVVEVPIQDVDFKLAVGLGELVKGGADGFNVTGEYEIVGDPIEFLTKYSVSGGGMPVEIDEGFKVTLDNPRAPLDSQSSSFPSTNGKVIDGDDEEDPADWWKK